MKSDYYLDEKGIKRNRNLRSEMATAPITSAEFDAYRSGREPIPEQLQAEFERQLAGQLRGEAAMRAVATKRRKYKKWPTRLGDHK